MNLFFLSLLMQLISGAWFAWDQISWLPSACCSLTRNFYHLFNFYRHLFCSLELFNASAILPFSSLLINFITSGITYCCDLIQQGRYKDLKVLNLEFAQDVDDTHLFLLKTKVCLYLFFFKKKILILITSSPISYRNI
jgi:hypothetical protein